MAKFPRWSGLKHFNAVSTTDFSDGQAFYDILKASNYVGEEFCSSDVPNQCILPCVVDLVPKNSSLVQCIRAYIRYRILVGLHCMRDGQIKHVEMAILIYQKCCAVRPLGLFQLVFLATHSI